MLGPVLSQFWGHFGTHFETWGLHIANMRAKNKCVLFGFSIVGVFVLKWGPDWDNFRMLFQG